MGDREDRELAGTKDKSSSVYQRANTFLKVEPCDPYCASGSSGSQSPKGKATAHRRIPLVCLAVGSQLFWEWQVHAASSASSCVWDNVGAAGVREPMGGCSRYEVEAGEHSEKQ